MARGQTARHVSCLPYDYREPSRRPGYSDTPLRRTLPKSLELPDRQRANDRVRVLPTWEVCPVRVVSVRVGGTVIPSQETGVRLRARGP